MSGPAWKIMEDELAAGKSEGEFTAKAQRSQRSAKLDSLKPLCCLRPFAASALLRLTLSGENARSETLRQRTAAGRNSHYAEDVRRMEKKNLAVEVLDRLLQNKIKAQTRTKLVQEKKYRDRLIEALRKYHKEGRYPIAHAGINPAVRFGVFFFPSTINHRGEAGVRSACRNTIARHRCV